MRMPRASAAAVAAANAELDVGEGDLTQMAELPGDVGDVLARSSCVEAEADEASCEGGTRSRVTATVAAAARRREAATAALLLLPLLPAERTE